MPNIIPSGAGAQQIDDLTDVDTTTTAPNAGEALVWDGTNWVPGPISTVDIIDDLNDVDTTTVPPAANDGLVWDGTANWIPGAPTPAPHDIDFHTDVDTTTTAPVANDALVWDGTAWVPNKNFLAQDDLTDTTIFTPVQDRDILMYDTGTAQWRNRRGIIHNLTDVDTQTNPPVNGDTLVWDNAAGQWVPGLSAPAPESHDLESHSDVQYPAAPVADQHLGFNAGSGQWEPGGPWQPGVQTLPEVHHPNAGTNTYYRIGEFRAYSSVTVQIMTYQSGGAPGSNTFEFSGAWGGKGQIRLVNNPFPKSTLNHVGLEWDGTNGVWKIVIRATGSGANPMEFHLRILADSRIEPANFRATLYATLQTGGATAAGSEVYSPAAQFMHTPAQVAWFEVPTTKQLLNNGATETLLQFGLPFGSQTNRMVMWDLSAVIKLSSSNDATAVARFYITDLNNVILARADIVNPDVFSLNDVYFGSNRVVWRVPAGGQFRLRAQTVGGTYFIDVEGLDRRNPATHFTITDLGQR